MEYNYGFEYSFPEGMEGIAEGAAAGALGVVTGILLIVWLLAMGIGIASYVLNAVGMYRIAKRRGIHHAWLAWIPVGCNWLLGSISDHYQYVTKQKVTRRRTVLLVLSLVLAGMSLLFFVAMLVATLSIEAAAEAAVGGAVASVILAVLGYMGMMGLSIAIVVFCYIAYYDLFRSCKPGNAVLFLVLGILFNITLAIFVFICSGHDQGMPERRAPKAAEQIPTYPEEEPAETWTEEAPEEEIPTVEAEVVEDQE